MRLLSATFRSVKLKHPNPNPCSVKQSSPDSSSFPKSTLNANCKVWCVYLILSTTSPIKTYIGSTTDFSRRLRQHNGEIKGGAKACRAGRPWICACIVRGFNDQSEACEFESKWKGLSRKLPRKRKDADLTEQVPALLLQHRERALNRVKGLVDCNHLEFDWQLNSF